MNTRTTRTQRRAFPGYFGISAGMALVFLTATFLLGEGYTTVDRVGGALWIMFLTLIIAMVVVIPRVNERNTRGQRSNRSE